MSTIGTECVFGSGPHRVLAYALGCTSVGVPADQLWALLAFVVLVSVLLHGIIATPTMNHLAAEHV